jgi:hypothetical protein
MGFPLAVSRQFFNVVLPSTGKGLVFTRMVKAIITTITPIDAKEVACCR